MADSNLSTSISAIVTELVNKVSTATASELVLLTRAANVIDKTEHSALETAVNSRVNALYSTASVGDLSKLSSAIGNLKEPVVSATSVDLSSVAQHILPVTTNTYNIGSASKLINELHANSVSFVSGTITTTPTNANDLVNKSYVDNSSSGGAFTSDILPNANGTLDIGSSTLGFVNVFASSVQGLTTPANATDAANKAYVDAAVVGSSLYAQTVNGYAGTVVLETDDVAEGIFNVYYTDSRVDTHLNISSATTGQTLIWNGTDYSWATPAASGVTQADIDTSIANLVDSAPTTLDTLNELAAALGDDANFSTTITNQIAAKADPYSIVSVTTSSGNFYIDGEQQGIVTLQPGRTYRFDQSDASNNSHPLRFSEVSDGTHAGGGATAYTTGVTVNGTAGNAGAYVEIVVTNATPRMYYYCANHSGMGGKVSVGKEMFVERITSDTWITGPIQTSTVNVGTGGAINATLGTVDFTNSTVVFSGATVNGLSNSDVGLANIADNAQGVVVTGKVAANNLDIGTGGSINAALTTVDFSSSTVVFSGATVNGLNNTIQGEVDFHLNQSSATSNQVLSWNGTDYAWVAQGGGGASVSTSDTAPSSPSDGDMWFDTTDTLLYVYYNDGTSSQWVQSVPIGGSGGSNTPWTSESASYSAVAGKKLLLDTSSTAITVTLPASPAMGDEIRIIDATGNAATNNITINRNGNKIQGQTDNLTVATNRAAFGLVFYNTSNGWLLTEK